MGMIIAKNLKANQENKNTEQPKKLVSKTKRLLIAKALLAKKDTVYKLLDEQEQQQNLNKQIENNIESNNPEIHGTMDSEDMIIAKNLKANQENQDTEQPK